MLFDKSGNAIYTSTGIVRSVNHRGFCTEAPENTLPAFILSKKKGFAIVECDIKLTSDSVDVVLHDDTIDRTSNGSGSIWDMTYEEASSYDYGSWFSEDFAGTKLLTLKEFLLLCKHIGLHAYIDFGWKYGVVEYYTQRVVDIVKECGMKGNVTYISFDGERVLTYIKNYDSTARLGYLVNDITTDVITTAQGLKMDTNDVFIDAYLTNLTDDAVALCVDADIPLEVWTVNDEGAITAMNPYITGVTSDNLVAEKVLFDKYMTV